MAQLVGSTIGKYQIEAYIGGGGMADVYRALNPSTGNLIALKVMKPEMCSAEGYAERFEREAHIATSLSHPYILNVFDYDVDKDRAYLTMDYVPTGSLKDLMQADPLPLTRLAVLLEQVASALDYAHRKGVLHRDIKPDNVLIDESGNPLLSDFGLARLATQQSELSASGQVYGTPRYMAPEQILGDEVDHRCDVYALGVILFELLTGVHPFEDPSSVQIMFQHAHKPVPSLQEKRPDLPESLQIIVERAMAKKPEDRYNTAGELAAAFAQVVRGERTTPGARQLQSAVLTDTDAVDGATMTPFPVEGLATTLQDAAAATRNQAPSQAEERNHPPTTRPRRLIYAAVIIVVLVALGAGVFIATRSTSIDAQMQQVEAAIENANKYAVEDNILALGAACNPNTTAFAGTLNDAGVEALENQELTYARLYLLAATSLDDELARNCANELVRSGVQRSFAWMNYGALIEADSSLSPEEREQNALNAYRVALERNTENLQAAYLLGVLLIETDPTPADLDEIVRVSTRGLSYLETLTPSPCEGQHDSTDIDAFEPVRHCFLLKTIEAHARYLRGDNRGDIEAPVNDGIDLAVANDHFVGAVIPTYAAEAYYIRAMLLADDETTEGETAPRCDALNNVIRHRNPDNPMHTNWAETAINQMDVLGCE